MGIKPVDDRRQIGDLADFVLRAMPRDERDLMETQFGRMGDAIERWITDGTEKAVSTMGR
jgi:PTH1 family peptidyl-tRNA hydrolase